MNINDEAIMQYGGFWRRAVAILIDTVIIQIAAMIVGFVVGLALGVALTGAVSPADLEAIAGAFGIIVIIVAYWLYFTLMESSSQQATIGKRVMGLRVTNMEGARLSFGHASGRYFAKILSLLSFIGFYLAGWTKRKQALHDFVAKTLVVRATAS